MRRILFSIVLAAASSPVFAYNDFESWSHQQRMQILEQAEACNRQALTREAFRRCEAQERQARQAFRKAAFEKRKRFMIQHLKARLQCIEQADSPKTLKACKPRQR